MANIKLRHKKIDGTRSIFPFVLESFLIVDSNFFLFAYLSLPAQAEGSWRDRLRLIGSHKVHSRNFYKNNFLDFSRIFLESFCGKYFSTIQSKLCFSREKSKRILKVFIDLWRIYWFIHEILRKIRGKSFITFQGFIFFERLIDQQRTFNGFLEILSSFLPQKFSKSCFELWKFPEEIIYHVPRNFSYPTKSLRFNKPSNKCSLIRITCWIAHKGIRNLKLMFSAQVSVWSHKKS